MKLFPYVLVRIAGDTFENFEHKNYTEPIEKLYNKLNKQKQDLEEISSHLSNELLLFNQQMTDRKIQNLVQNVRRDIFNDRRIKTKKFEECVDILPSEIKLLLLTYKEKKNELKKLQDSVQELYDQTYFEIRNVLCSLAKKDSLQNGLLLSSQTLLTQLPTYINSDEINSKNLKLERNLLKYLSRIYTKTSPFSSFTNVSIHNLGDVEEHANETDRVKLVNKQQITSHLRINSSIFNLLKQRFKQEDIFYRELPVRINPTVKKTRTRLKYLVNNNNSEIFFYLDRNAILDLIFELLKSTDANITYKEFVAQIHTFVDADKEDLENYLTQLINVGVVEIYTGISGLDPNWNNHLARMLKDIDSEEPRVKQLTRMLKNFDVVRNNYSQLSFIKKNKFLINTYDEFNAFFSEAITKDSGNSQTVDNEKSESKKNTHRKRFGLKPESFFYEDTSKNVYLDVDSRAIESTVSKLNLIVESLNLLDGFVSDKENMRIYFEKKYNNTRGVSLLKFYEDYYKDFRLVDNFLRENSDQKIARRRYDKYLSVINDDTERKKRLRSIEHWRYALKEKVLSVYETGTHNLEIDRSFLPRKKTIENNSVSSNSTSYGAFIQFYTGENGARYKAVVNSTSPGYGKMFSRFLHLFPNHITEAIRDLNEVSQNINELHVENSDASCFNANIHPPLMSYEIWMPQSQNSLPRNHQISVLDLIIKFDKKANDLILIHSKTKKRVYVYDLGFQGVLGRSELFKLLLGFTKMRAISVKVLSNYIYWILREAEKDGKKRVITYPRITFEQEVVIARKRWEVPYIELPKITNNNSDDFHLKLNDWRINHDIPAEVFIILNPNRFLSSKKKNKRIGSDDYKPQYINFLWPQYINLFIHMIRKEPEYIIIEEMLPGSSELLKFEGERYVSEVVVNWHT